MKTTMLLLCILKVALGGSPHATTAPTKAVWDISQLGLFDATNKAYVIKDGLVDVDLSHSGRICPTGLGHLASGMASVKAIRIVFDCSIAGEYWLHLKWNPGGSGDEQFAVLLKEEPLAMSQRVKAEDKPEATITDVFRLTLSEGKIALTLKYLSGDGLRFEQIALNHSPQPRHAVKPALKYPTLKSYEQEIREPGVMLDGEHVILFAPKQHEQQAKAIFERLIRAYDFLYQLVGIHTRFKIVVYHFPERHPDVKGGTSNCVIWYSYKSLDPNAWEDWRQYKVPHVCGYIEEMAHNFVSASGAQFGWEMIGWSISVKVTEKVAPNPHWSKKVAEARREQAQTFTRYIRGHYVFPNDLPSNQVDRIHAYILNLCERRYGPKFWSDFFAQIRKSQERMALVFKIVDDDGRRNARYVITLDCFDRLEGLQFKSLLNKNRISLTTDIKSLYPTEKGWNRRLHAPDDQ